MTVLEGILQGLLQGITEFLPVSSSGHLALFQHFTGNSGEGALLFSLMLHMGTLAAVVLVYYQDLFAMLGQVWQMAVEIAQGRFAWKTNNPDRKLLYMLFFGCLPLLLLVPLNGLVSKLAQDNDIVVEGVCFLITSALLFSASSAGRSRAGVFKMKPKQALAVGVMQSVAAMPGISRSGATISTGVVLGFDREFAAKFSFLLGIPAILGGAVFEAGDAMKQGVKLDFWPLFLGMLAAAVSGYICIRLVRWMLVSNRFKWFAWYTLVLGVLVVIIGIVEHIMGGNLLAQPASEAASQVASNVLQGAEAQRVHTETLRIFCGL